MTKMLRNLAIAGMVAGWSLSPAAAQAATTCASTQSSMLGWYSMLISGNTVGTTPAAKYVVGAAYFNGAGGFSGYNAFSDNGSDNAISGTYTQNADCTFTLSLHLGGAPVQTYSIAMRKSVNEAVGIETDASAVANIDLTAQYAVYTPGLLFGKSSMNGTYTASCAGPFGGYSDLNYVTLSNGVMTGTDPYNNGGSFDVANNPYNGTYTVYPDGTFGGTLVVDGATFDYYGVITAGGTEIQYIYLNVSGGKPTNAFASCTGKL
jgi:hypothetical protein